MFIELTDHLRCPQDHPEAFLVLLPDRMNGRRVEAGHLGCPVCGWSTAWDGTPPDFGGGERAVGAPPYDAAAAQAMLGIDGPGGWLALAGRAAALAPALASLLPNVGIVAINPAQAIADEGAVSVLLSGRWPIKAHAMRGVLLGSDASAWRDAALASVLPSRHLIGEGEPPAPGQAKLLATAAGVWVAQRG